MPVGGWVVCWVRVGVGGAGVEWVDNRGLQSLSKAVIVFSRSLSVVMGAFVNYFVWEVFFLAA